MTRNVAVLAFCLLLHMQRLIRLPNAKVSTILLSLLFLYDIFFVFITEFIMKESVMVKVATGGSSGESVPMLMRVPRFNDELGGYGMLGLGDVALPGLFVSFLMRFDYRKRLVGFQSYFNLAAMWYTLGLIVTDIVLISTGHGQPALLYLVPCTLGPVFLVAWRRGHLTELWEGPRDDDSSLFDSALPSSDAALFAIEEEVMDAQLPDDLELAGMEHDHLGTGRGPQYNAHALIQDDDYI